MASNHSWTWKWRRTKPLFKNVLGVAEKSCFEKFKQMLVSIYPCAGIIDKVIYRWEALNFQDKALSTIHGMTRCCELVDIFKKIEIGISYNDVTNLYAIWAKQDVESGSCPFEIAYDLLGTAIMDNDDFQNDTLTGATGSYRTNVMFVQLENQARVDLENRRPVLVNQKNLKILPN